MIRYVLGCFILSASAICLAGFHIPERSPQDLTSFVAACPPGTVNCPIDAFVPKTPSTATPDQPRAQATNDCTCPDCPNCVDCPNCGNAKSTAPQSSYGSAGTSSPQAAYGSAGTAQSRAYGYAVTSSNVSYGSAGGTRSYVSYQPQWGTSRTVQRTRTRVSNVRGPVRRFVAAVRARRGRAAHASYSVSRGVSRGSSSGVQYNVLGDWNPSHQKTIDHVMGGDEFGARFHAGDLTPAQIQSMSHSELREWHSGDHRYHDGLQASPPPKPVIQQPVQQPAPQAQPRPQSFAMASPPR